MNNLTGQTPFWPAFTSPVPPQYPKCLYGSPPPPAPPPAPVGSPPSPGQRLPPECEWGGGGWTCRCAEFGGRQQSVRALGEGAWARGCARRSGAQRMTQHSHKSTCSMTHTCASRMDRESGSQNCRSPPPPPQHPMPPPPSSHRCDKPPPRCCTADNSQSRGRNHRFSLV